MCAIHVAAQAAQYFRDHAISAALVDGVDFLQKRHSFLHAQLFGAVDALAKSAPAGTEGAVSFLKQSLTAASSTYEQMNKATKQLFELMESNFATAVKAPAKKAA